MMDKEQLIEWAREAKFAPYQGCWVVNSKELDAFAKLVADAEAKRMQDEGMVTAGHMREQIAKEREQCAQLFPQPHQEYFGRDIQDAIRARSST
jgi:hypothetical protein